MAAAGIPVRLMPDRETDVLARLYATIEARVGADPAASHTAALLAKGAAQMRREVRRGGGGGRSSAAARRATAPGLSPRRPTCSTTCR